MAKQGRLVWIVAAIIVVAVLVVFFWFTNSSTGGASESEPVSDHPEEQAPESTHGVVSGQVYLHPGDTPLAGAQIMLYGRNGVYETESDEEGAFEISVPAQLYHISAEAPGLRNGGRDDKGESLRLPAGEHFSIPPLILHEPAAISGKVLEEERPADALVAAFVLNDFSGAGNYIEMEVETNVEGEFLLTGLPPGELIVRAEASGFAPRSSDPIMLQAGDTVDIGSLRLERGAALHGRVLDGASGEGLASAKIAVFSGQRLVARSTSEVHGYYNLYGINGGAIRLQLSAEGYVDQTIALELATGDDLEQDFQMEQARGLTIEVHHLDGSPYQGALVEIWESGASAPLPRTPYGLEPLHFDDLTRGPFVVKAIDPATGTSVEMRLMPGEQASLLLASGARISGVLLDPQGVSIDGVVDLLDEEGKAIAGMRSSDSAFTFDGIAPGSYYVEANVQGMRTTRSELLVIRAGDDRNVPLRLGAGGQISGVIRAAEDGSPIPQAAVRVEGTGLTGSTDEEGQYSLQGVPNQLVTLVAVAPGRRASMVSGVQLRDGEQLSQDFELALDDGEGGREVEMIGVGMQLGQEGDEILVINPLEDAAAARAGIEAGDVIESIDGQPAAELGLRGAIENIRGEEGTVVTLVIRRDGNRLTKQITREQVVYEAKP